MPLSAPVSISMLLCFGNRHNHITVCDETIFISSMTLYQQAMLLAIHFARRGLLGHSPIPCPSQKFLLRLRVLQTLSPALATYLNVWFRAGLVQKIKEPGLEVSLPLNPALHRLYRNIAQNIRFFFLHYSCCFNFMSLRIVVLAAFNKSVSIRIS